MTESTSHPLLWITGAGSGMGRAIALRAARGGRRVVLSGRREAALNDVAATVRGIGGDAVVAPLDVTDASAVADTARRVSANHGDITDLVVAAGLNAPKRYWRDQNMVDFEAILATNLAGAAAVTQAALPAMRTTGSGSVIFISSHSGWTFSPDAGVAYSASKTALASLARTLNAQEGRHGIRACHLCPGDVDSDFLGMRPIVPNADARSRMLSPDDVARAVDFILDSPRHVRIDELVITPVERS